MTRPEPRTLAETLGAGPLRAQEVVGCTVGPYVIEGLIAQGGIGAVFRGLHVGRGERVALKVLTAGAAASETQRRRFRREAELLTRLTHPGIVAVRDFGEEGSLAWLAMELVEGPTLVERLPALGQRALVRTLERAARALAEAHAKGVVHRDLKPANILLRPDGSPVIADLGLARDLEGPSSLTRTGAALGTPLYMAPEQARGQPAGAATDVHALGIMLYEGLTGHLPWQLEDSNPLALMGAVQDHVPDPPSALRRGVPKALDRICLRALEKDPRRRYPDAGAFADALAGFLAGRPAPDAARRRAPLILGAVVALGALGALGVALSSSGGGSPPVAARPPQEAPPAADLPEPGASGVREPAEPAALAPPAPTSSGERTLVLQPGPLEGYDALVRNDGLYWNDNGGSDPAPAVGDRQAQRGDFRILLRFTLDRLPADAEVRDARLRLSVIEAVGLARALTVQAQLIVPSESGGVRRTPWVEGTSTFDAFLDGVCWDGDLRLQGASFPTSNSRRPELTQPDVDLSTDFGTGVPGLLDRARVPPDARWLELDLTAAVRLWLARPDANHGLRLAHSPEGEPWRDGYIKLGSSDHRRAELRPRLTIVYRGPAPAPEPDLAPRYDAARSAAAQRLAAAEQALRRGEAQAAWEAAQAAVEAAPFLGAGYLLRGRIRALELGQPGAGLVDLRTCEVLLEPATGPELWEVRAVVSARAGDLEGARLDLDRLRTAAPDDPRLPAVEAELQEASARRRP